MDFKDIKQVKYHNNDLSKIVIDGNTVWEKTNESVQGAVNLDSLQTQGKRVLVRIDLNPIDEYNKEQIEFELQEHVPTIKKLADDGAKVIVCIAVEQKYDDFSEYARILYKLTKHEVTFASDIAYADLLSLRANEGEIVFMNNLLSEPYKDLEMQCSSSLTDELKRLCDIYVNDAPRDCDKEYASCFSVPGQMSLKAFGYAWNDLFEATQQYDKSVYPKTAIIGGNINEMTLELLYNLLDDIDYLYLFGDVGKTVLKIKGYDVIDYSNDYLSPIQYILKQAENRGVSVFTYEDVVVSDDINATSGSNRELDELQQDDRRKMYIIDIGDRTACNMAQYIGTSKLIYIIGKIGVAEHATRDILMSLRKSPAKLIFDSYISYEASTLRFTQSHYNFNEVEILYMLHPKNLPVIDHMQY